MSDLTNSQPTSAASSSKRNTLALDAAGYILFVIGAFAALATTPILARIPLFNRLQHPTQIMIGGAVALLGIALLVISDKRKSKAKGIPRTGA